MIAPTTKLHAAEHDLKQLMVEVARAIEKAQQAVNRITGKATNAAAEAEVTAAAKGAYADHADERS